MDYSGYDMSYMYFYSERPGTLAARRYTDDIPLETKKKRLQEIVDMQGVLSTRSNEKDMGKIFEVLIEGNSKKNDQEWTGRSSQNKSMVFPKTNRGEKPGDYVQVLAEDYTRATLLGKIVYPA
jgi:tRNA-2-methylthio-N6-dimethylallyladenosine synthase